MSLLKTDEEGKEERGRKTVKRVSLKDVAKSLGLSPATVSLVLNGSPAGRSIPEGTRKRVVEAAKEMNYRPNLVARSLRSKRSFLIGVLVPEVSEGYSAAVISGIEDELLGRGYAYLVTGHRHKPELLKRHVELFRERQVEGLILVDTPMERAPEMAAVSISGHKRLKGVTNIVLNHDRAAELALEHLMELGHREIAFIQGQEFSSDTAPRWEAIRRAAAKLGLKVAAERTGQLLEDDPTPGAGYRAAQRLMEGGGRFTALFAFNDVSAIGAMRALHEAGRRVPGDVSVIGFDDIPAAAFHNPSLTTIRQPLKQMGRLAAERILDGLRTETETLEVVVEPELIRRESSAGRPGRR